MPVELDLADRQFLDALVQMKVVWSTEVFPRLYDEYVARVRAADGPPSDWREAGRMLRPSGLYHFYAGLELTLQQRKYAVLLPAFVRKERELRAELRAAPRGPARLELDSHLRLPRYYTRVDFHQHPGGVWSDDIDGFVYEYAARSTNPTFGSNTEIFQRLAGMLATQPCRRAVDLGCGFGKTTTPLADAFPGAEIYGVDLAAPCLKVAWLRAVQRGLSITYRQENAEHTQFPNAFADLVTAHQLLHEVPTAALRRILQEAARLLRPGGRFVVLDFHSPRGPFETFIHYGHAVRNNEPYMRRFNETDLRAEYTRAGFIHFAVTSFGDEFGRGRSAASGRPREWRFPWKLISATRREAR